MQSTKKELETPNSKKALQKKVSPIKPQVGKREDQIYKSEKGGSKDKNWKPPMKAPKKSSQNTQSNVKS